MTDNKEEEKQRDDEPNQASVNAISEIADGLHASNMSLDPRTRVD